MLSLILSSSIASAQMVILDPQNRLTFGVTYSDGSPGITASFDSRLSQLVFINIGAFRGFSDSDYTATREDPQSWLRMRHGLWAAPGLRFPHRYKKNAINWDFLVRTGFGCIFSDVSGADDWLLIEPAGLTAADLILRKENYGVRLTAKTFLSHPYIEELNGKHWIVNQQQGIEVFYQWQ